MPSFNTKRLGLEIFIIIASFSAGTAKEGRKEGVFESLRGYMSEIGNVLHDVTSGLEKVGKGIRNVEEFLDATIDEECIFECANGGIAHPNPVHLASSNGCGSFGLEEFLTTDVLSTEEFVHCCDAHDICYGTCATDKDECDLKFKKCLYRKCSAGKEAMSKFQYKGCLAGAKILHAGTTTLGCKSFINAQKEACLCPKSSESSKLKEPRDEF